jgi:site-specific DNA recombinase
MGARRRRPAVVTDDAKKALRCAIYTRVSTDGGLEQDFNSLHAQREACEAYALSQSHEGWKLRPEHFDDGGFSGGSLDRPALQNLLERVRRREIDVILVYKVDRLTRSLADFAKLVELFDAHDVSFVSITQSFNTTTSMGRLTLNVLLSFAQFEREVTGERIRDKIAASKKKGIWVGGVIPFGYQLVDHRLVPDEIEAPIVRDIFARYLRLRSIRALAAELLEAGILTRKRPLSSGRTRGGVPFTSGPLAHILKNQTYLGRINHRGQSYPSVHPSIVDPELFAEVQKLIIGSGEPSAPRQASGALLIGKLFDADGRVMTPTHAQKGSRRYRYYVTRELVERGAGKGSAGARRVPATAIEASILAALSAEPRLMQRTADPSGEQSDPAHAKMTAVATHSSQPDEHDADRKLIDANVARVTLTADAIAIELTSNAAASLGRPVLQILWTTINQHRHRAIVEPLGDAASKTPMRPETRATLLAALGRGHAWLDDLITGTAQDTDTIASREKRSKRTIHMMLSLAFLAPDVTAAAIDGKLPSGIAMRQLIDLPADWARQRVMLGLA